MVPGSAETCRVKVAGTIPPALIVLPSLFQVKVRTELAATGSHCVVVIANVSAVLPGFFK